MVFYLLASIFLSMAFICFINQGLSFIEGWKASRERLEYNERKLNQAIGIVLSIVGFIFLLSGFDTSFKDSFFMLFMILWFLLGAFLLFLIEKTSFFKLKKLGGKEYEHK